MQITVTYTFDMEKEEDRDEYRTILYADKFRNTVGDIQTYLHSLKHRELTDAEIKEGVFTVIADNLNMDDFL